MSDDFDGYNGDDDNVIPFDSDNKNKVKSTEKLTDHVLEDVFDIEEGSTVVPYVEREPTELVVHETYDDKDNEIEGQLQEVIDYAMEAFENTSETAEDVEPQYKARNQEVAAQYLNTALAAINSKSNIKQQKDKLEKMATRGEGGAVTNNIIVDRNDLLRALRSDTPESEPIDGECADSE